MGGKVLFLFIIAFGATVTGQSVGGPKHGKKVVCYLSSWKAHQKDQFQFLVPYFDPSLCTHLVYSFAKLNEKTNHIYSSDEKMDINRNDGKAGYNGYVALKKQHPHLKVTLCIGGWYEGSVKYSKMAANSTARNQFIESVIIFLQTYKFDGLDIMWMYPTTRGGIDEDKANFVTLIKELKQAFQEHKYILTAALGGTLMNSVYDLVQLNQYLDLIHVMAYDYHGPWEGVMGSNTPLHGTTVNDTQNVENTIKYMIESGVSPEKMVLGLTLNNRYFCLTDPKVNPVMFGATPVNGSVIPRRNLPYNKVCLELKNKTIPWEYHWDEQSSTPYLRDKDRIISYDNSRSIANKVKLAIDYNVGGFMIWSIDSDDFKGLCDIRNDTYKDFENSFKSILEDPDLQDALQKFVLPNLDSHEEDRFYVIESNKLKFNIREQNFTNYQLMRTINQATTVALDEIKILEALWKFKMVVKNDKNINKWKPTSADTCVDSSCLSSCIQTCVKKPFLCYNCFVLQIMIIINIYKITLTKNSRLVYHICISCV